MPFKTQHNNKLGNHIRGLDVGFGTERGPYSERKQAWIVYSLLFSCLFFMANCMQIDTFSIVSTEPTARARI